MTQKSEEKKKTKKTEYEFYHPNKYLSVVDLGVQFYNHKFSTSDRELAKKLINIEDIQLISQP